MPVVSPTRAGNQYYAVVGSATEAEVEAIGETIFEMCEYIRYLCRTYGYLLYANRYSNMLRFEAITSGLYSQRVALPESCYCVCSCPLCTVLLTGPCSPRFISFDGDIHDLMAVNDHDNHEHPCYDCEDCEYLRQWLHMYPDFTCQCSLCDLWREEFTGGAPIFTVEPNSLDADAIDVSSDDSMRSE